MTERIRGRKLQEIRTRFFHKNPLCQCSDLNCPHVKENREHIEVATILDHIKPLHQGGTNEESNYQALCGFCHEYKTVTERGDKIKACIVQGLDW